MEQEMASIIRFIVDVTGAEPYYWKVPEDFRVPAVYFSPPEITSYGDTFSTYRLEYMWFIVFFHRTDVEAYGLAQKALDTIRAYRNMIPLIGEDGEPTGGLMRVRDPILKVLDNDACQLEIDFDSRRPYRTPIRGELIQDFTAKIEGAD